MDRIDVLQEDDRRYDVITGEVLGDRHDAGLQTLTQRAREVTSTPIAGVSLVLQTIQYFRADDGLPGDLAQVRAVARDTAFCQYVVRDRAPFMVTDVESNPDVPRDLLRRYGIRSYLGHPVRLDDTVLGAMCVFDTRPRVFADSERDALGALADQAEAKLALLADRGLDAPQPIRASLEPAVAALHRRLRPLRPAIIEARVAALEVEVLTRALSRRDISRGLIENLAPALSAVGVLQRRLASLESTTEAAMRSVELLREVAGPTHAATSLVELVEASDAIARPLTVQVGGVRWRLPLAEYIIALPRPQAVSFMSTALATIAGVLRQRTVQADMWVEVAAVGNELHVDIGSARLRLRDGETTRTALRGLGLDGTSARVALTGSTVQLALPIVRGSTIGDY